MPFVASDRVHESIKNSIQFAMEATQQKTIDSNKVRVQVISVQNTPISFLKNSIQSFIKNHQGTHNDSSFTKATSFNMCQKGAWLKNPATLELNNRVVRSKDMRRDIKDLKSLIKDINLEMKPVCNNNSEHVISQSIICRDLTGIKADKDETEKATTVRSILVNNALAYQENRRLHENHTGTRWTIEKQGKNDDVTKYNTFDSESNTYFDDKGGRYAVISGGVGKDLSEIQTHEKQRVQFNKDVASLLRNEHDISSAVQMNQIGYANIISDNKNVFRESRNNDFDKLTNDVADYSFYHMVNVAESVVYANEDVTRTISNDKELTLTAVDIDDTDRVEMILSRLVTSLGRYPVVSEVKEIINKLNINVPEHLSGLKGEIVPSDKETPFYEKLRES